jgi:hypothetical protein
MLRSLGIKYAPTLRFAGDHMNIFHICLIGMAVAMYGAFIFDDESVLAIFGGVFIVSMITWWCASLVSVMRSGRHWILAKRVKKRLD